MHVEAMAFVKKAAARIGEVRTVVEFGAHDVNGSAREAFPRSVKWFGIDKVDGPGVDYVADLEHDDLDIEGFDLGVSTETLEHVMAAGRVLDLLVGAVAPGGHVLVTCATEPRAPHGCNGGFVEHEWYRNIAPWELAHPRLEAVLFETHVDRGDVYLLGRVLEEAGEATG